MTFFDFLGCKPREGIRADGACGKCDFEEGILTNGTCGPCPESEGIKFGDGKCGPCPYGKIEKYCRILQ